MRGVRFCLGVWGFVFVWVLFWFVVSYWFVCFAFHLGCFAFVACDAMSVLTASGFSSTLSVRLTLSYWYFARVVMYVVIQYHTTPVVSIVYIRLVPQRRHAYVSRLCTLCEHEFAVPR